MIRREWMRLPDGSATELSVSCRPECSGDQVLVLRFRAPEEGRNERHCKGSEKRK
jgi:hypothetical protein